MNLHENLRVGVSLFHSADGYDETYNRFSQVFYRRN